MKPVRKRITVRGCRRSRFHDERGNRIDVSGLAYLPHCLLTTISRLAFGIRPTMPWIGYRAIKQLERTLQNDWTIVEFGSGMSTLWLAERCNRVISVEEDSVWHAKVSRELRRRGIQHVDYRLRKAGDYHRVDDIDERSCQFVLIDGIKRGLCAAEALRIVADGGFIYLDNSDKHADSKDGDTRVAEDLLLSSQRRAEARYFVDFVPTHFFVTQGLLLRMRHRSGPTVSPNTLSNG